ncbi:hypothetical protein NL676_020687 [Syzygium grande]|nr:hypothetical protein NL676_020687 [Syzygium grande]
MSRPRRVTLPHQLSPSWPLKVHPQRPISSASRPPMARLQPGSARPPRLVKACALFSITLAHRPTSLFLAEFFHQSRRPPTLCRVAVSLAESCRAERLPLSTPIAARRLN